MPQRLDLELPVSFDCPYGYLEDVPAVFVLEFEDLPAEDFALASCEASATLKALTMHNLTLRRPEVLSFLGEDVLQKLEELAAERFLDRTID